MRFVASLGVGQAVLPPQPRPDLRTLRRLGFEGNVEQVLRSAEDSRVLRSCSSSSSMWAANAATVTPSSDSADGRLHLTVANLSSMFHRSLEAETTTAILRRIFASGAHFAVHGALPPGQLFSDEGAANHTHLHTRSGCVHLFAYGRSLEATGLPREYPARQTLEASQAVARVNRVRAEQRVFWRQDPAGIDAGAFHTDVLAVGNEHFLMLHEHAFVDGAGLLRALQERLGEEFQSVFVSQAELPVAAAVSAYPFNSQLVTLPSGGMAIVAPAEARDEPAARRFLERVVAESNPVQAVHHIDVNASMKNGGGPACLRLRVPLTEAERSAISARVFFDDLLHADLARWIERHYRDRLSEADLADPALVQEVHTALDELTALLALGSIYDFQQA
jgi:succinylarginine dihydrolase